MDVNEEVRQLVEQRMEERGMTQKDLADAIGVDRVYINRMLRGNTSQVPGRWGDVLRALGLRLTVKDEGGE